MSRGVARRVVSVSEHPPKFSPLPPPHVGLSESPLLTLRIGIIFFEIKITELDNKMKIKDFSTQTDYNTTERYFWLRNCA